MKLYICDNFKGHWPVGVAAVIVADNQIHAAQLLENVLAEVGLKQDINKSQLAEIDLTQHGAYILNDGDY